MRHVKHVALDQCLDIIAIPVRPAPSRGARQRWRESPCDDIFDELFTEPPGLTNLESIPEQGMQESSVCRRTGKNRSRGEFILRKWMEPNDLKASSQRLGQAWDEQYIGGTSEYETARHTSAIHFDLYGGEQLGNQLYLVQDHALGQVGDETCGIRPGTVPRHRIVEADVGVVPVSA